MYVWQHTHTHTHALEYALTFTVRESLTVQIVNWAVGRLTIVIVLVAVVVICNCCCPFPTCCCLSCCRCYCCNCCYCCCCSLLVVINASVGTFARIHAPIDSPFSLASAFPAAANTPSSPPLPPSLVAPSAIIVQKFAGKHIHKANMQAEPALAAMPTATPTRHSSFTLQKKSMNVDWRRHWWWNGNCATCCCAIVSCNVECKYLIFVFF